MKANTVRLLSLCQWNPPKRMEFVTAEFSGFLTALHTQVSITKCDRNICIFSSINICILQ